MPSYDEELMGWVGGPSNDEVAGDAATEDRIPVVVDQRNGWRVEGVFRFRSNVPVLTELHVTSTRGPDWVPSGGVTTEVLRRVQLRRLWDDLDRTPRSRGALALHGQRPEADYKRRPGRPGRPDVDYAVVAAGWVDKVKAGSRRPNVDLAADMPGYSPAQVRDLMHEAGRRGLIVGRAPGKADGGKLTAKAIALLNGGDDE